MVETTTIDARLLILFISKGLALSKIGCPKIKSGWWYTYPSEKWWSWSVGIMKFPTRGKTIKFHGSIIDYDIPWNIPLKTSKNPITKSHGSSHHQPDYHHYSNYEPLLTIINQWLWRFPPDRIYPQLLPSQPWSTEAPWVAQSRGRPVESWKRCVLWKWGIPKSFLKGW